MFRITLVVKRRTNLSFSHTRVIMDAGEGAIVSALGNSYTYKASKEETRGAYALIETTVVGDGPPPCIHKTEEETFYVLEGSLKVFIGEHTFTANVGAFVLVPRGTVHTFSKVGMSARILIIISAAGFEKFFEEMAGPLDLEKVEALASKYNLEIVGPLPGQ
jgi:mannose-6-phosphate isomerase-like protein (cupin superfamily)